MTLIEDIVGWAKNQAIYLTGRGLIGLGMAIGAVFMGLPTLGLWPLAIAVGSTAALQAGLTWRKERQAERQLMNAYREEVASTLKMNPQDVTLEQLHEVAEGNPEINGDGNPILKDALERISKRHTMQMVTSGMAAIITFGATFGLSSFLGFDLDKTIQDFRSNLLSRGGLDFFTSATSAAGVMTIAGTGMSLFNKAFDQVGERMLNIHKDSAHDMIVSINRDIARGKMVSQEQVFGVFVTAQPKLAAAIAEDYGKTYEKLTPRQQHLALSEHGRGLHIRQITHDLNHLQLKPQELAFAAVGQSSGVSPKHDVNFREEALKEKTTSELLEEVKRAALGEKQQTAAEPANDNAPSFAERFTPRAAQGEKQSFVERYAADHKSNKLERVLHELRGREGERENIER